MRRPNALAPRTGETGRLAEDRLMKRMGGRATPASGAMDGAKGDIRLPEFLIEAKSTVKDSFSVKLEHLAKIRQEAMRIGKVPALAIQFTTGDGRPRNHGSWVAIPEELWEDVKAAIEAGRIGD